MVYYFNVLKLSEITLFLFCLFIFSIPEAHGQNYLWPLNIESKLSSQFGDYRDGHWHAGIDITTRGKTGYKVYAVTDGYIYRIRTSFWGYGKALYLKLSDGCIAVYGHLTKFSPSIEKVIRQRQMNKKNYYQDIFLTANEFVVKKGDYIALTGQTGSGAPHLHFEIRDRYNFPLNPLKHYYRFTDNHPPIVEYLVVKRYHKYGSGNYHDIEFLRLDGQNPELFVKDTVAVYGQSLFAVSAYDPNNGYNYSINSGRMSLDGDEIFSFEHDRLDYSIGKQIDYVCDLELKKLVEKQNGIALDKDKNIFYRLYIQPHDKQWFYNQYNYPAGIIDSDSLEPGPHSLKISLSDVNGNECHVNLYIKKADFEIPVVRDICISNDSLRLYMGAFPVSLEPQIQRRQAPHLPYQYIYSDFDLFERTLTFPMSDNDYDYRIRIKGEYLSPWMVFKPGLKSPSVTPYVDYFELCFPIEEDLLINDQRVTYQNKDIFPLGNGFYKALIPVPVENGILELKLGENQIGNDYFIYSKSGSAYSPDSTVMIDFSEKDLFGPTLIAITELKPDNGDGYTFDIIPEDLLFNDEVEITILPEKLDLNTACFSLYYYSSQKSKWYFIGNRNQNHISGQTRGGGKFGILIDRTPPVISKLKPKNGSIIKNRKPRLSCVITDDLSGFKNETQFEMTIDGIWVPAYYDIDNEIFFYKVMYPLKPGRHILRVRATDNQGNKATAISRFTVLGKY
ncbi:MAG: hypothetical protein B6D58_03225 [candidate division Zixibacteria bacterium 4484_95]|nr:MAG: hypothetical protein B6D58_03225 [candidate division Zixibacteria bacterium 4484_95]